MNWSDTLWLSQPTLLWSNQVCRTLTGSSYLDCIKTIAECSLSLIHVWWHGCWCLWLMEERSFWCPPVGAWWPISQVILGSCAVLASTCLPQCPRSYQDYSLFVQGERSPLQQPCSSGIEASNEIWLYTGTTKSIDGINQLAVECDGVALLNLSLHLSCFCLPPLACFTGYKALKTISLCQGLITSLLLKGREITECTKA